MSSNSSSADIDVFKCPCCGEESQEGTYPERCNACARYTCANCLQDGWCPECEKSFQPIAGQAFFRKVGERRFIVAAVVRVPEDFDDWKEEHTAPLYSIQGGNQLNIILNKQVDRSEDAKGMDLDQILTSEKF